MLNQIVTEQIFAWLVVFSRIGSAFMVMPTIGDAFVPARARLLISLAISILVTPVLVPSLPKSPESPFLLLILLNSEIIIGLFLGLIPRIMMGALEVAGMIIGTTTGLANASVFNPALASQGSLPGALLGWLGLLLIFATDLHHLLITAVVDSYGVFKPGSPLPIHDMTMTIIRVTGDSFNLGARMAAPFLIVGLMFALALGILAKLTPQIQVFFIFTSSQIMLGLALFALTLSAMMTFWLTYLEDSIIRFLARG
ncbi:Flagellar biosynthetic protein FliR [uncultured Gammaproteobacteria bacterium]